MKMLVVLFNVCKKKYILRGITLHQDVNILLFHFVSDRCWAMLCL